MGFDWLAYGLGVLTPILVQIFAAIAYFKLKFRKIKKDKFKIKPEERTRINRIVKEAK